MNVLLVEPEFPIPPKSKNHRDFLPIGLLKLASYHRQQGDKIRLVRGNQEIDGFKPDHIKITSLFTYWSKHVWDSVKFFKEQHPYAKVTVGGIYASLMPEHCKQSGCDEVFIGVDSEAEKCRPAYDLVDVDYQIIHTSRGCVRRCSFCGTWRIEPTFTCKRNIKKEVCSNRIIFYDNNLLANPHIQDILKELSEATHNGNAVYSESQCGIDGRFLTPLLASLLKKARFVSPRIAWDNTYEDHRSVKRQLDILTNAGYKSKDIFIFMIYNWRHDFEEMEKKRLKCWEWKAQIADCRYRPLTQTYDNYNPKIEQTINDYYIHPRWTDRKIKQFRKNVRRQNICVRHGFSYYSKDLEQKSIDKETAGHIRNLSKFQADGLLTKGILNDLWCPNEITPPPSHLL
jgi:hypothetical protein